MRRTLAVCLVSVLVATGCGDDDDDERGLEPIDTPTFSDEPSDTTLETATDAGGSTDGTTADTDESTDTVDGTTSPPDGDAPETTTTLVTERVSFDDPVGDATPGVGTTRPPAWTDLAGGALQRRGNAYQLDIRLAGEAPPRAPGTETMNIASFFDVDGDGAVEYEIWVNLGPDGWGPVWYDDRGNAAPGADSNVTVEVAGDTVSLLFPDVLLDAPERLRFSLASEYGDIATIGSSFARRDDAPDDDRAVSFP